MIFSNLPFLENDFHKCHKYEKWHWNISSFSKINICILGFFHEINKPACHHNLIIISIHIKVKCFARTFAAADISTKSRNVYHYGLLRIHDFISLNHVSCFFDKSHFFTRFFSDEFFHFSCKIFHKYCLFIFVILDSRVARFLTEFEITEKCHLWQGEIMCMLIVRYWLIL